MPKKLNWTLTVALVGLIIIIVGFFYPSEALMTISNLFMIAIIFIVIRNSRNRKKEAEFKNQEENKEGN